jgi:hypothetical protein
MSEPQLPITDIKLPPPCCASELSRCDAEIAEIRVGTFPAWLAAMAELDWLIERQLILESR